MRRNTFAALACLFAALLALALPASADVTCTTDGAAGTDRLYVAGMPDAYPVEAYRTEDAQYVGAAPAFLRLVSERTGLDFAYIRAGAADRRATLARNRQVELLFAASDETALLEGGAERIRLFTVMRNGETAELYCVFTSIARADDRAAIRAVAESLTGDEIAALFTADAAYPAERERATGVIAALCAALALALVAVLVLALRLRRRRRHTSEWLDAATRLGNRQSFLRSFNACIDDPTRELCHIVWFAFDIRRVNVDWGPDESDAILRFAAKTLSDAMRGNEFCARIGGGSFAALLVCDNGKQAEERVTALLDALNAYDGRVHSHVGAPLFRASVRALSIEDRDADGLLESVERACLHAAEEKQTLVFVDREILRRQETRASLREQAAEAIEKGRLTPYVQLVVRTDDGAICGGEMLSRWENRTYGRLNPADYIQLFRELGLIAAHDRQMMENAFRLLEAWHKQGRTWFLTCNLSRVTISESDFAEQILAVAERYDFPRERMVVEVTEDMLEEDKEAARRNVEQFKRAGFHIALDDFPAGFNSLTNLYEYEVDLLKIARELMLDAEQGPHAAAVITEITRLSHDLGIRVMVEGVERAEQARLARETGCDYIQGFYYFKPLPVRELDDFAANYQAEQ